MSVIYYYLNKKENGRYIKQISFFVSYSNSSKYLKIPRDALVGLKEVQWTFTGTAV